MNTRSAPKIVLLGMMTKMPVAGVVWQTMHYLLGLQRLGFDVYYAEDHGMNPSMFTETGADDGAAKAAAFIAQAMSRFGLGSHWSYRAWHDDGRVYGMSESQLLRLYKESTALINLHGATLPREEHRAAERFIFIGTDPVMLEVELHERMKATEDFLDAHDVYFTFGENLGAPDCKLPLPPERYKLHPTRQPVILDFWQPFRTGAGECFTTIGNWLQPWRDVTLEGQVYTWSKHHEFLKFLGLPRCTSQQFELALSRFEETDREMLEANGWRVRKALEFSRDLDAYRQYIAESRGEWTVAKDQNIRLRSGWFSDRSATYLAAGRPVVTQETGFSNVFPTGAGLFGFSTLEEVVEAVEKINADYKQHSHAAYEIAHDYFSFDVVLPKLLDQAGISVPNRKLARSSPSAAQRQGSQPDTQLALADIAPQIPFINGVNVIGYLRTESGVGEAARGYVRALQSLNTPVALRDVSDLCGNRAQDSTLELADTSEAYDVNLVCVDIDKHFGVMSRLSEEFFQDRYNIGVWAWETQVFPKKWYDRFAYYDEIWAGTNFIADFLSPISPVPVLRVPPVLGPASEGSREAGRSHLEVTEDDFVFLFIFDGNSTFRRKNPLGLVEAFRTAFAPTDNVRLVLKSVNGERFPEDFAAVKRRAQGWPITIHDGYWSTREMQDLMAACDAYVSLHRSEGTGLTIADAMAAGKPVLATGWSGNMDFMTHANSYPLRYELIQIEADSSGPYRDANGLWAEVSLEHAAEQMRHVVEHRDQAEARGRLASVDVAEHFSSGKVAAIVEQRLRAIAFRRHLPEFQSVMKQRYSEYVGTVREIRRIVAKELPNSSKLLVASRGDEQLVSFTDCDASHFPRTEHGTYAGRHPESAAEVIKDLDHARRRGAEFFLLPNTMFWWFDSYPGLRAELERRFGAPRSTKACVIFDLRRARDAELDELVQHIRQLKAEQQAADSRSQTLLHSMRRQAADGSRVAAAIDGKRVDSAASPIQKKREHYLRSVEQVHAAVRRTLPLDATLAVVTRGDAALLHFEGRRAWHFPRTEEGQWAGHHPKDSEAAIAHLEELRKNGLQFFVLPSIYFWWLDHYAEFGEHLTSGYKPLLRDEFCAIYDVREPAQHLKKAAYRLLTQRIQQLVDVTLPIDATIAVVSKGDPEILNLRGRRAWHLPRTANGLYAGRHPADTAAVIAHIEELHDQGAEYLLLPAPYFWWLNFYPDLETYLDNHCRVVHRSTDAIIYDLRRLRRSRARKLSVPAPRRYPRAAKTKSKKQKTT